MRVRTPTVLQLEAVECGAASLAMVLAAHGRWVPLDELRVACGVSRDGSKASSIVRAARRYGLEAKGFQRDLDGLYGLPMPAIAFVNLGHFVVVEGFARGKVHVNDPATGRRVMTEAEFDAMYSGVVLTFTPTDAFERGGSRPPVVARLVDWIAGGHAGLAYVVLAGVGLILPGVFVPALTRIFIDQYLLERQDGWVVWVLAAIVATVLVQAGLLWLKQTIHQRLKSRIAIRAGARFVWRMLRIPVTFFAQRYAGAVGVRSDYAPALGDLAAGQLGGLLIDGVAIVFFAAVMASYSVPLTIVVVGCGAANLAMFFLLRGRVEALEQKAAIDQVKLQGKTMQGLQMIESLKANGTEGPFFTAWSGQHALVETQQQTIGRAGAVLTVTREFLAQVSTALVLLTGGYLVMQGSITIGMLVAFQGLQVAFNAPVQTIMQAGLALQSARGALDQFDDVLAHPLARELAGDDDAAAPSASPAVGALGSVRRLDGGVTIRGLTFGYSPLDPPLIANLDLDIAPGARVALVGASGSGKSTVGKLLAGLYEPWSGEILVDGRPLVDHPRDLLRNSVAVVDQDIVLFDGTVHDNVTLWDDTMPESSVVRAAKDAAIHDVVVARPGGYQGRVEEGGRNFSGGERQRLEIARALVTDPTLLVLDEATSALDPPVEQTIMDNLRRRGCACLIIAHRLSTIRDCDEILVMHEGEVLQHGTHEALIATDGPYRRLVEA